MIVLGLDTETTGLKPDKDRIIELAIVAIYDCGSTAKCVYRFNANGRPIDPAAQRIHGISESDIAHEKSFSENVDAIVASLQEADIIVGHNIGFDMKFIEAELKRCGIQMPECYTIDTSVARWATIDGKTPTLKDLCWACEVDYDPKKAHSALYDVEVVLECFNKFQEHFDNGMEKWGD